MDEISGNYSSCSNRVKKTINAIMLSLNKMSIVNGTSNGILASDNEHNSDGMMLESINDLIHEHKNSFLPSKNNFNMDNKKIPSCKFLGSTELGERISSCKKEQS